MASLVQRDTSGVLQTQPGETEDLRTLRVVNYRPNDAHAAFASLECFEEGALFFMEPPDGVFVGRITPVAENVDAQACEAAGVPVVRSMVLGRSHLSEAGGRTLWVGLVGEGTRESNLQDILVAAFAACGMSTTVRVNDIVCEGQQVAMTAPALPGMVGVAVGVMSFAVDFERVNALLRFPADKWSDKAPATSMQAWVRPVETDATRFMDAVREAAGKVLVVELRDGAFTASEVLRMTALKTRNLQDDWLWRGRYE